MVIQRSPADRGKLATGHGVESGASVDRLTRCINSGTSTSSDCGG